MTDKKPLNIHEAMLKFHSLFHGAKKTGENPHFKSVHFTLDDIVNATTPVLQKCGLYVLHQTIDGVLVTSVRNAEGESIETSVVLPSTPNPQVYGSNLTYFKRYNSTGLFNIAEEDDDGNLGADAAEIERQKEKTIVPKPKATDAQLQLLADWIESGKLTKRQTDYISANLDKMTTEDAQDLLDKIKIAQEIE
jgi:hypothetical protein